MITPPTWHVKPAPDPAVVAHLSQALATQKPFPEALASILAQREIDTYEAARAFFQPQISDLHAPRQMKDMDKAVARLIAAHEGREPILLFGDYDVDGTTSVALLTLALRDLGFEVVYYVPDRYQEGYGLSYQGIDYGVEAEAKLMITLDCGIKGHDKVRYANLKDLDVIICDHHTPGDTLPEALAVLDPKRSDCPYPYQELTGCGVGMKLLMALTEAMRLQGMPLPEEEYDPFVKYCDLLTLSIACDIVPITGENRLMAYHGLHKLRENPLPGIAVIQAQAKEERAWNISDLVFFIGPRINAAGRLEHALGAVEVLLGQQKDLITLAEALQTSNDERKHLDRATTEEALQIIAADPTYTQAATTVLCRPSWHKGIIGIVASRLVEHHHRPTVLLTESEGKLVGSARSVPGFDLYQALAACDDHLLQWGGHKYAAGLSLEPERFEAFQQAFDQAVADTITPEQKVPLLVIDAELPLDQVDERLIRLINRMEPFGPSNRRPTFMARGVQVLHETVLKDVHIKLVLQQESQMVEAIGFHLAERFATCQGPCVDVAFQPIFNTWNGKTRINLRLKDVRPAQ
jgi:single-stranded-DNA-specific exonuclease